MVYDMYRLLAALWRGCCEMSFGLPDINCGTAAAAGDGATAAAASVVRNSVCIDQAPTW